LIFSFGKLFNIHSHPLINLNSQMVFKANIAGSGLITKKVL
jgi:hypothetical protein